MATPELVTAVRSRAGISQEELARRMDVSFASVNAWENGRSSPRPRHRARLEQLAAELGVRDRYDVVVVDRDAAAVALTADLLRSLDPVARVSTAASSTEALVLCGATQPRLVLLDVDVPGPDTAAVAAAMGRVNELAATLLVGMADDPDTLGPAPVGGLARVLQRPVTRSSLVDVLELLDVPVRR